MVGIFWGKTCVLSGLLPRCTSQVCACIGLFLGVIVAAGVCPFSHLFLVIYIRAAQFRFIRSWVGEETKSYVGLWSGFCRRQIELGVVYELYYGVEICFLLPTYHIICWAYENTCDWSFVLRAQLANLIADCRFEHKHKLYVKSELFLFSTLSKHGIESSKLVNTPSVQQSVKKQTCSLAFTFVHVLTQVVCCYAPLLFPRFD